MSVATGPVAVPDGPAWDSPDMADARRLLLGAVTIYLTAERPAPALQQALGLTMTDPAHRAIAVAAHSMACLVRLAQAREVDIAGAGNVDDQLWSNHTVREARYLGTMRGAA